MSIEIVNKVWKYFPEGGTRLLIMLKMADWADDQGGHIYPSMRMIGERTRISTGQARRQVHTLIDDGWLLVVSNEYGGARGMTRNYQINFEKLVQIAIDLSTTGVNARGGANATPQNKSYPQAGSPDMNDTGGVGAPDGLHPCKGRGGASARQSIIYQSLSVKSKEAIFKSYPQSKTSRLYTYMETAEWIYKKILLIHSSHKRPNFKMWANEIKKIRTDDKKTDRQIRELFSFANGHKFFHKIILDPYKLRLKWDELCMERNSQ